MRIDVITAISLKDDDGHEITRSVSKAKTMSFTLEDETVNVQRRIHAAATRAKEASHAAIAAVLDTLRS